MIPHHEQIGMAGFFSLFFFLLAQGVHGTASFCRKSRNPMLSGNQTREDESVVHVEMCPSNRQLGAVVANNL